MNIIDEFKQNPSNKNFFSKMIKEVFRKNQKIIHSKVKVNQITYRRNKVNEIVFNEKSHIVAVFKDYLIYDDEAEFFKR